MTLGFKRQFGLWVWEGSKTHTLRGKGGREWKPGVMCNCFIDSRQKGMARLGDWVCTRVEDVRVWGQGTALNIAIAGELLSASERTAFAWRDGFRTKGNRSWEEFCAFWLKEHGKNTGDHHFRDQCAVDFDGVLIHWKWTEAGRAPLPAKLKGEA